jgi:hypothetical protein
MTIMTYPKYKTLVPTITTLRQDLGYGGENQETWKIVYDSASDLRKVFVTSKGLKGTEILDWKSKEHQDALADMTDTYLEANGNGRLYWPEDSTQNNARVW